MGDRRAKQFYTLISHLKNIGPKSNAKTKFIIDKTPCDDEEQSLPSGEAIITGRLLPKSDIYKQGSIEMDIILGPEFPMKPPKVLLKTKVYHPNVTEKGEVSTALLSSTAAWKPATPLVSVFEEVIKIIDEPSIDLIAYPEAASLYDTNKKEYERVAAETFNKNCKPRD